MVVLPGQEVQNEMGSMNIPLERCDMIKVGVFKVFLLGATQQRSAGIASGPLSAMSRSSTFTCGRSGKKSLMGLETVLKSAFPGASARREGYS